MELDVSTWNDLSDREKLEWLRARLLEIENTLGALPRHVDEISNILKEIEFSGVVKAIEKKQKRRT
jgi:hypothetical protein